MEIAKVLVRQVRGDTHPNSSSENVDKRLPLQVFGEFTQTIPPPCNSGATVCVLLFQYLACLVVSVQKLTTSGPQRSIGRTLDGAPRTCPYACHHRPDLID